MFMLNRLGINFANGMEHGFDVSLIRSPTIGVKLGDAEWLKQGFVSSNTLSVVLTESCHALLKG